MVEERGVPLSIVVTGANRHDVAKLADVLDGRIVVSPEEWKGKENLCADAGYVGEKHRQTMIDHGYIPHVRPRGEEIEEKEKNPEYKPRRWIVEVSHSWFNRFKKLKERFEKKAKNFLALHHLAACIIALRKIKKSDGSNIIYG